MYSQNNENSTSLYNLQWMESLVKKCIHYESEGNIKELQNSLYQLNALCSGKNILNYKEKDELALCFAFMLQHYWIQDHDIREVWAEDGFYCAISYSQRAANQPYAMLILFILLCVGRESLKTKIQDTINTSRLHGPSIYSSDDYRLGAQHVIDQFSRYAVMGIKYSYLYDNFSQTKKILTKYNGVQYFEEIKERKDLMKYDFEKYDDVLCKADFLKTIIGSILMDY